MNELAFLRMMAVNRKITSKPKTAVSHGRYIHKHAAGHLYQCSSIMGSKRLIPLEDPFVLHFSN